MNSTYLIHDVQEKYGEWLEMYGEQSPYVVQHILADLLIKERENVEYLNNRIKHLERKQRVL